MNAVAYEYRAIHADGRVEHGRIPVATESDARSVLERRGLLPIELRQSVRVERTAASAISPSDLALGFQVLADLLDSGLPLVRALQATTTLAPVAWRRTAPSLVEAVRQGKSFGASLREAPARFPAVAIGMIDAGEAAGQLSTAIRRVIEILEASARRRAAVAAALAYPALLAVAGTSAVAVMVGVVIPRYAVILTDIGQRLPASTRMVIQVARLGRASLVPMTVALGLGALAMRIWTSDAGGRRQFHESLLRVPYVGGIRHAIATARATLTLAALLDAGVALRPALRLAGTASGDAAVESRVQRSSVHLEGGAGLAVALERERALTMFALPLVQAGEEAGSLATMLTRIAGLEGERADRSLRTAVQLLEPMLVLAFGVVIAAVAAALLQAVYSLKPVP